MHYQSSHDDLIALAPLELKFAGGGVSGEVRGYGSVFGVRDQHGDIVEPGAFTQTIREHKAGGTRPLMLWSHDPSQIIGVWHSFQEDAKGLRLSGRLNLETTGGREAHALLKQGAVSGLSIGFRVLPGGAKMDAKGVRHLTSLQLFEVSIVGLPSNGSARVDGIKMERRSDFERFLKDAGFPNGAARKLSLGGWPALAGHDEEAEQKALSLIEAIKQATSEIRGQGGQ